MEIVIVGGGIVGLATACALNRKGIKVIVLERSETLRAHGVGIGIYTNGWRALDQIGVGDKLRDKAIPIGLLREIWTDGSERNTPAGKEEIRCLKRSDLIEVLADALPPNTIRFGCKVTAVNLDPITATPIIQFEDGTSMKAKIVIGCDGGHSVVAKSIGVNDPRHYDLAGIRGFAQYPNGHSIGDEYLRWKGDGLLLGIVPIDHNVLYWFAGRRWTPEDSKISRDPVLIRESMTELFKGFPEMMDMLNHSDDDSLSLLKMIYRTPWDVLLNKFRKGTITVAGDSMHVMGPFLGQGGSAGLEDAVVLGRSLGDELRKMGPETSEQVMQKRVGAAIDRYVKDRRARLVRLCTQSYLIGRVIEISLRPVQIMILLFIFLVFGRPLTHARYDCGRL